MNEREAIAKWMNENPERADKLRELCDGAQFFSVLNSLEAPPIDQSLTMICGPDHGGIDGSQQRLCECGAVIWLSPSTQKVLAKRGDVPTRLVCMRCGGQAIQNEKA